MASISSHAHSHRSSIESRVQGDVFELWGSLCSQMNGANQQRNYLRGNVYWLWARVWCESGSFGRELLPNIARHGLCIVQDCAQHFPSSSHPICAIFPFADYIDEQRKFDFTRARPETFPFANLSDGRAQIWKFLRCGAFFSNRLPTWFDLYIQFSSPARFGETIRHSRGSPTANYKRILIDLLVFPSSTSSTSSQLLMMLFRCCLRFALTRAEVFENNSTKKNYKWYAKAEKRQRLADGGKAAYSIHFVYLFISPFHSAFAFSANVSFHFLTLICFALKVFPLYAFPLFIRQLQLTDKNCKQRLCIYRKWENMCSSFQTLRRIHGKLLTALQTTLCSGLWRCDMQSPGRLQLSQRRHRLLSFG